MASPSETVRACVDAFLRHDQDALSQLLAPDVEWLENGLPHHESFEQHERRGKWEGADPGLQVNPVEVCADDATAVFEFDLRHGEASAQMSGIFKVADGKVQSVHWYGDPERGLATLWPQSAAA